MNFEKEVDGGDRQEIDVGQPMTDSLIDQIELEVNFARNITWLRNLVIERLVVAGGDLSEFDWGLGDNEWVMGRMAVTPKIELTEDDVLGALGCYVKAIADERSDMSLVEREIAELGLLIGLGFDVNRKDLVLGGVRLLFRIANEGRRARGG